MLQHMISLLFLFLPFSLANPKPTPTLPFTVAAFQSPFPPTASNSVTGLRISASDGFFWAGRTTAVPKTGCGKLRGSKCPAGNETVLWVDREGKAFLDSADPQQIYIDTRTGALSYLTPVPTPPNEYSPGANVVNFLHLGHGTNLTSVIPGADPHIFVNPGPGTFNWLGSDNSYWFLCPQNGNSTKYQIMKEVTVNDPAQSRCLSGIALVAIDYSGASPAAGVYL